jgi:chorismate mutase / prephenate dehydratase
MKPDLLVGHALHPLPARAHEEFEGDVDLCRKKMPPDAIAIEITQDHVQVWKRIVVGPGQIAAETQHFVASLELAASVLARLEVIGSDLDFFDGADAGDARVADGVASREVLQGAQDVFAPVEAQEPVVVGVHSFHGCPSGLRPELRRRHAVERSRAIVARTAEVASAKYPGATEGAKLRAFLPVCPRLWSPLMSETPSDRPVDLDALRQRINELDAQVQEAIAERARLAQEVGMVKSAAATDVEFFRPEREAQVLREVIRRNQGPLRDKEMVRLFREIMSACLSQQEPLKIGFLGPAGTFSHQAVLKHFGHSVRALPMATLDEVFAAVQAGDEDFGVVPIENSSAGVVSHTLDLFLTSPLHVCGEVQMRIRQHLMGRMSKLEDIRRVCAHPQSLAQCRGWLREFLPEVELVECSSNAEGARRARDEEGSAAIAPRTAAEIYELEVLYAAIEDESDNRTRFLVVGRKLLDPSGEDRTTLMVSTAAADQSGSLHALLEPLASRGVNLTRIESRPSRRRSWHYVFFLDLEGHASDPDVAPALAELESRAELFRVLGSYPKAVL